ncbi:MAG: NAD(P)-dependent oxidoreductase [Alphaproteobacteria bacterium]
MSNVMLTWYATPAEVARIKRACPEGTRVFAPRDAAGALSRFECRLADLAEAAPKADAIMGWVLPDGLWRLAQRAKALAFFHAGCDELDFVLLKKRGIQVASIRGANSIPVAEHAFALVLGLAKRMVERHRWVEEARWRPMFHPDFMGHGLAGKTIAIVGYGGIGTALARRAKSFDMTVLGVRRDPKRGGAHADEMHGPSRLHAVLKRADFVVLSVPMTAETDRLIDANSIAAMKTGAFLVNIARGNLVVEAALHAALVSGKLGGYAADVWWNYTNSFPATYHYPLVSRTGLHRLPNVIRGGGVAADIHGVAEREIDMGTESIAAFLRGERMPRRIDLDLGY